MKKAAKADGTPEDCCFPSNDSILEFVPLVYGLKGYGKRKNSGKDQEVADEYTVVLGFNEPSQQYQSI